VKVIIASCVFPPEPIVSASTSYDLALHFFSKGDEVQVVCPKPSRNLSDEKAPDFPFSVDRIFSVASKGSGFFSRFIENISFGLALFFYILRQKNIDAIYGNVWPIFASGLLVLASKIKHFKIIVSVQDLYPESLIAQGRISKEGVIAKFLVILDRWIAENCHHIIVISEGFKGAYISGRFVDASKVTVVKNWVKDETVDVLSQTDARKGLIGKTDVTLQKDEILCVYGGNIGSASGLEEFIEYIESIDIKVKFLFAGNGTHVERLKNNVAKKGIEDRVAFLSPWPKDMTASVLCSADILLLPTTMGQEFASVPSKLITYMLSSRPVLLIADSKSESAKEVLRAECGFIVEERTPMSVADSLNDFSKLDDKQRREMGAKARGYAQRNYSFDGAVTQISRLLEN